MKLFLEILLFIFITNIKAINAADTFIDIQKATTSFSFKLDILPEQIDKNKVAEHHSPDGHTRKVMDDGQVATCSTCSLTREKYKAELDKPENKDIKRELDDLEARLDKDPENKELIKQHEEIEARLEKSRNTGVDKDKNANFEENNQEGKETKGGAYRAAKYSEEWSNSSLNNAIDQYAPGSRGVKTAKGKTLYKNDVTGIQVVYDDAGNYFRIENTNLTGKRKYLDLDGNLPNNKVVNGRVLGRNQSEYNQVTHFNNID